MSHRTDYPSYWGMVPKIKQHNFMIFPQDAIYLHFPPILYNTCSPS
ncbi:hypothetical protein AZE42_13907 [Rhizopogon vesiculosus]|uniref:Uncharacterized protein n=1 Tax=Rhizopogon vesiculosus TaxID=180088 RepID=A0A1J8R568_9AGAM|nr:hypothetical protein AZE42_13907 [Rhizopogon vesiculosus]